MATPNSGSAGLNFKNPPAERESDVPSASASKLRQFIFDCAMASLMAQSAIGRFGLIAGLSLIFNGFAFFCPAAS
jgi:hypothetical protein